MPELNCWTPSWCWGIGGGQTALGVRGKNHTGSYPGSLIPRLLIQSRLVDVTVNLLVSLYKMGTLDPNRNVIQESRESYPPEEPQPWEMCLRSPVEGLRAALDSTQHSRNAAKSYIQHLIESLSVLGERGIILIL